jgi:hypothetical protein
VMLCSALFLLYFVSLPLSFQSFFLYAIPHTLCSAQHDSSAAMFGALPGTQL